MRALSTPLGVVLLALVTVATAATVGAGLVGVGDAGLAPGTARPVDVGVTADAGGNVTLVHRSGPPLDTRSLRLRVTVDGTPLRYQPPVPFFATRGFRGGPTGPFNPASDPTWTAGERAGFRVAGTNDPALAAGAPLAVAVFRDGRRIALARTVIRGSGPPS